MADVSIDSGSDGVRADGGDGVQPDRGPEARRAESADRATAFAGREDWKNGRLGVGSSKRGGAGGSDLVHQSDLFLSVAGGAGGGVLLFVHEAVHESLAFLSRAIAVARAVGGLAGGARRICVDARGAGVGGGVLVGGLRHHLRDAGLRV